jgi:23S rRNA (uridine2479-2'-O)-methyltransferase
MPPRSPVLRVSTENTLFQHLEVLKRNRHKRHRAREFVVEGVQAINQARANGWRIKALVYAAGRPLSSWAREVVATTRDGARRVEVAPPLMERLSDKEETSELLAVVGMPEDTPERIALGEPPLVAVFDRPVYPGNLGQIVRAADALGADGLLVTGHGADLYDPQTVRASMGSLFALPVVRLPSHREAGRWVAEVGAAPEGPGRLQLVGGSVDAPLALDEVDLTRPTVLVFGNETAGLSRGYRDLCDVLARIPMHGAADSLNVASAASIMLYEASRQRRAGAPR